MGKCVLPYNYGGAQDHRINWMYVEVLIRAVVAIRRIIRSRTLLHTAGELPISVLPVNNGIYPAFECLDNIDPPKGHLSPSKQTCGASHCALDKLTVISSSLRSLYLGYTGLIIVPQKM